MERAQITSCVRFFCIIMIFHSLPSQHRRSHLPEGVKTKQWEHRMEQTKRAQAIKKLQQELKDEKQAEIQR
jgi:hypothetical protein